MKSLQTIQKTFRVFQTLTKIAMIFSYVWAGLAALGLLCALVWRSGGSVYGGDWTLLYTLTETGGLTEMTAVLCVDAVSALLSAILLTFAYLYLKAEQADGTPFTRGGADKILRLGVQAIVLSVVNASLTEAVFIASDLSAYANADRGNLSGVTLGITLILASLIFRYGAELEEKNAQSPH